MNHRRADIHQQPLAGLLAFDAVDRTAGVFDHFAHAIGQRAALAVGVAGGDDYCVENRRYAFYIEHLDVTPFDIFECVERHTGHFI